ncbi:MAG TPA: hypothetical protein DF383_10455, partial [Deltaproteobacteria bacterium]|nr:hypothetical protein [Deltaproteobacteria bacterium]
EKSSMRKNLQRAKADWNQLETGLSDLQAKNFWKDVSKKKKRKFRSMQSAVKYLKKIVLPLN